MTDSNKANEWENLLPVQLKSLSNGKYAKGFFFCKHQDKAASREKIQSDSPYATPSDENTHSIPNIPHPNGYSRRFFFFF